MSARNRKRDGAAPDVLACAMAAAARGWAIVPLKPASKAPLRPWGDLANRPPDPAQVQRWFRENPDMNYGIATGAMSGVMVIDIDSSAGADTLKTYGVSAQSHPSVRSGRPAGLHVYGAYPPSGMRSGCGVLDGVDVRADRAYIVGPGSRHPSGTPYLPSPGFFEAELLVFPEALLEVLAAPRRGPDVLSPPVAPAHPFLIDGGGTRYGLTALWRETEKVARAPRDTRNKTLNTAALKLFRLVAGGELDEAVVQAALEGAAERCGLVADEGWGAVRATIASGRRAGNASPRPAPSRARDVARAETFAVCAAARASLETTPDGWAGGPTPSQRRIIMEVINRCETVGQLVVTIPRDTLAMAAGCCTTTVWRALRDLRVGRWVTVVQQGGAKWDGQRVSITAATLKLERQPNSGEHATISTRHGSGCVVASIRLAGDSRSKGDRLSRIVLALAGAEGPMSTNDLMCFGRRSTIRGDLTTLESLGAVVKTSVASGKRGQPPAAWLLVEDGCTILARHLAEVEARLQAVNQKRAGDLAARRQTLAGMLELVNGSTDRAEVRAILDDADDGSGGVPFKTLDDAARVARASEPAHGGVNGGGTHALDATAVTHRPDDSRRDSDIPGDST